MHIHDDNLEERDDRVKERAQPHPDAELDEPDEFIVHIELLAIFGVPYDKSAQVVVKVAEKVNKYAQAKLKNGHPKHLVCKLVLLAVVLIGLV